MSLIPVAAQLIRRAAEDDGYAQDLRDAVAADDATSGGLLQSAVQATDLPSLTPTQWQWFGRWRQALGGPLDPVLLAHLTGSAATRFSRFEVRSLVLRDPLTNQLALEAGTYHTEYPDDIGLNWLERQAKTTADPLELAVDALQCATEASWFVLRQLTSLDDERGDFIDAQLDAFAAQREVSRDITDRWRFAQ